MNIIDKFAALALIIITTAIGAIVFVYEPTASEAAITETASRAPIPRPPVLPLWKIKYPDYMTVRQCLIQNVFYEAPRYHEGFENTFKNGRYTRSKLKDLINIERVRTINVVMSRLRNGEHPDKICKVIYKTAAFSWTYEKWKFAKPLRVVWKSKPIEISNIDVIERLVDYELQHGWPDFTGGADHYHAHYVKKPRSWKRQTYSFSSPWSKYYNTV